MYYGYVYCIQNLINGKKYIGMHKSEKFDPDYYGSGILIKRAIEKYGKENFKITVLHWCKTKEELIEMEYYEMKKRNVAESTEYYNVIENKTPILYGEDNGFYRKKHTEETKQKIANAHSKIWSEEKKRKHSKKIKQYFETNEGKKLKERLKILHKGKQMPEETKQKIIKTFEEKNIPELISYKLKDFYSIQENYNRIYTNEFRKNVSERFKNKPKTEEHKRKISEAHKNTKKPWVAEKINKNPEKIRKTAEKHRGMKRSEVAKRKMSEAKKGKPANNKGKKWIHNPITHEKRFISKNEPLPDGWKYGYGNRNKKIIQNTKYEVLTPKGFKDFDSFLISEKETITLYFDNNETLSCTKDHLIFSNNQWIEAKLLKIGDKISTINGETTLIKVENNKTEKVVDLVNVEDTHSFFANNILVHNCLYLDEFAFVKPSISEEFWKSILPTLSAPGSRMIITSTPNGSENKFAEIWFKAVQNENDFNPIEVLNEEVPGRESPEFKQQMLKDMTELEYAQEFENQFISSSGTLIYSPILEALKPIEPIDTYGDLRIFKSPENRRLALSVDVGTGVGQDYSVIEVFDLDTFEQVAEFRNNQMNITDFTKTLIDILRYFHKRTDKEIIYTIEANSIGQGVIQLIENSNIGFLKDIEMISERKRSGILMTTKSKSKGCSRLKDLIESGKMKIYSRYLISELKFFVKSGESFKAEKGKHDDLVMGCVLFCLLLNEIMDYDEDVYEALNTVSISSDVDEEDGSPLPFII